MERFIPEPSIEDFTVPAPKHCPAGYRPAKSRARTFRLDASRLRSDHINPLARSQGSELWVVARWARTSVAFNERFGLVMYEVIGPDLIAKLWQQSNTQAIVEPDLCLLELRPFHSIACAKGNRSLKQRQSD